MSTTRCGTSIAALTLMLVCIAGPGLVSGAAGAPAATSIQQPVVFSVTGDVPYGSSEVSVFQDIVDDHNLYSPSNFIVHIGDILAGDESCNESRYQTVADILKTSEVPAFIIPGDNETTDCSNSSQGWSYWKKHLLRIEENFCGTSNVERQSAQDENFAFITDGMLFIGIHLVGGSNKSSILQNDADWVTQQFEDNVSLVRGAVVFSQAGPGGNSTFFNPFESAAAAFGKPILFIHGDGHSWKKNYPFSASNVLRVQIQRGDKDPVQVTAGLDANDMFQFERSPFSGASPITRGPCGEPPASVTLTVQVQGGGNVTLNPSGGTYAPGTNVTLQAVPDAGWTFASWSNDLSGNTNPEGLTLNADMSVTATFVSNTLPIAQADTYDTDEDGSLVVSPPGVLLNDMDPDGDPLSAMVDTEPTDGNLQLIADGSFTYTPDADFNGTDAFSYLVDDGRGGTAVETVTILVQASDDAPNAQLDSYSVAQNSLFLTAAPGVLGNDIDVDGDALFATLISSTTSGDLALSGDGSFQYIPSTDFMGTDSFTYQASDGTLQSPTVTVTITVTTPTAGTMTLLPIADTFTLSTTPTANYGSNSSLTVEEDVNIHHSYLQFEVPGGALVLDARLRLFVTNPSNDGGTVYAVSNDYSDGASPWTELGIVWDNAPAIAGTAVASTGSVASGNWVEFDVSAAITGPGTYSLGIRSTSTNSARYSSREGSNPPQLVIGTDPNSSPIASNDAYSTPASNTLVVGTPGILGNDVDPDADPLTVMLLQDTSHGALTLNADGSFSYTPDAGFMGVDSFRYAATDPASGVTSATVNLHVRSQRNTSARQDASFTTLGSTIVRWSNSGAWRSAQGGDPLVVSLETQQAARAALDVFNVSGRRVRHLSEVLQPNGQRRLTWNGRNERGVAVAGGVYFVRLTVDRQTASRKVIILR